MAAVSLDILNENKQLKYFPSNALDLECES